MRDEIVNTLEEKPKLLEQKTKVEKVFEMIITYVNTFFDVLRDKFWHCF